MATIYKWELYSIVKQYDIGYRSQETIYLSGYSDKTFHRCSNLDVDNSNGELVAQGGYSTSIFVKNWDPDDIRIAPYFSIDGDTWYKAISMDCPSHVIKVEEGVVYTEWDPPATSVTAQKCYVIDNSTKGSYKGYTSTSTSRNAYPDNGYIKGSTTYSSWYVYVGQSENYAPTGVINVPELKANNPANITWSVSDVDGDRVRIRSLVRYLKIDSESAYTATTLFNTATTSLSYTDNIPQNAAGGSIYYVLTITDDINGNTTITSETVTVGSSCAITGSVIISGSTKELSGSYVNIGGVWKEIVGGYVYKNNTWLPLGN